AIEPDRGAGDRVGEAEVDGGGCADRVRSPLALMSLAELVDGRAVGAGWPTSSKRGATLLFSAKSALGPGGTSVNQFGEAHYLRTINSTVPRRLISSTDAPSRPRLTATSRLAEPTRRLCSS